MVAKVRYIPFVYILIGFQLIYRNCECSISSTTTNHSDTTIARNETTNANDSADANIATTTLPFVGRKLSDDTIESISDDSNLLSGELLTDEQITNHDFPYFTEPTTTNGYGPAHIHHHHAPVHHHVMAVQLVKPLNKTYFTAPLLTSSPAPSPSAPQAYVPSGNRFRVQITDSTPWSSAAASPSTSSSSSSALSMMSPQSRQPLSSSSSSHELTHLPYLQNQYIASFRNIRSSVMNIIYKVQDFMSYVMSFFSTDGTMMGEARKKKKKKFHIKKKFKKFIIPLLIAYKLKFFAMIPLLIGGLVLLVGSTGMAGFFFALFAAVISLKKNHS